MNKINFENAPSTNTPLSAENLNQMQANMEEVGVVVSSTEPTTGEKVWFKKSNNIFNAYDDYDYTTGTNKISYSIEGSNKITVTSAGDWSRLGCTIPNLKPNTQYTVSTNITNAAGMSCGIYLAAGQYDIQTSTNFRAKYTGTTDANGKLYFQLYSNFTSDTTTADVIFDNIQVEQGTAATEYEPYVEKGICIKEDDIYEEYIKPQVKVSTQEPTNEDVWFKKGKNLLPVSATTITSNGVTFTVNSDGSIKISGTTTARTLFNINITRPIKLQYGSYTLTKTGDASYVEVYLRKTSSSEMITTMGGTGTVKKFTNTYTEDVFAYIALASGVTIDTTITLQLEAGNVSTDYEPYTEKAIYTKNANGVFEKFINAEVLGTILFSGHTNETVNLLDSVANYEYIEIFYADNDDVFNSIKVYEPNGKKISLGVTNYYATGTFFKGKVMDISETTISNRGTNYTETKISTSGAITFSNTNYIYVTRVVGYKR